ncbi:MAG: hypothetical protein M3436_11000 [Pseudomonadota bacterium]|nr:hypothetical protein [Pseudomonadota bacterium]
MQRGQIVLVDTNIIIEAVRTNCWNALANHFALETVDKCMEEALTGDRLRRGYVKVDPAQLRKGVREAHALVPIEMMKLALALPGSDELDPGERQLFGHALRRTDTWIASCADRAALKAAFALGWNDRIVSLEVLARSAGAKPTLKMHFTEHWLSEIRTTFLLDKGLS